jgi:protein-tyrosine phosphatase
MDPYGGTVQSYGLCFELIKTTIKKLVAMLEDDGIFVREDD